MDYNGIIVIDKPEGITSFDVVKKVRSLTGSKKVGHTGTLDPLATGVLPVCIGKATKAVNYLIKDNKEYIAEIKLGEVTDTYDREGQILETKEVNCSTEAVISVINSFKGKIMQAPPKYSALKIQGKKMYELARKGIEFEIPKRPVEIYNIDILDITLPYIKIKVLCSKGTYIRSLAYDIGEKLGVGAHIYNLRRTCSGNFNIETSTKLESLNNDNLIKNIISIEEIFLGFNKIELDPYFEKLFLNGVPIKDKRLTSKLIEKGHYTVYNVSGNFLGLGNHIENYFKMESLF